MESLSYIWLNVTTSKTKRTLRMNLPEITDTKPFLPCRKEIGLVNC